MLSVNKILAQATFATPEERRRAQQLLYILQALLLSVVGANVVILAFDWRQWPQMLVLDIVFPIALLILHWVRQGKVRLASGWVIGVLWLLFTLFVVWTDGTRGPAFFSYIAVILVAGLLLGQRAETAVLLLSLAVAALVFVANYFQLLTIPFMESPLAANWIGVSLCLVFISYVVRLTLADLRKTLQQERQIAAQNLLLREQAEQQARDLAAANAKLQELDTLKSKFVRDMTHELRTPLTNFKLYLDLWELAGEEKKERYLQVLREQNGRLAHLVDKILRIAKIEANEDTGKASELSLGDVARQVADAYQLQLERKGLAVQLDLADDLPVVCVARAMLVEAVDQLMANAVAYSQQGTITLRTFFEPDGELVCLQVADEGIGIPEGEIDKLFDRFYRGVNVGELSTAGAGLGLTIAERIMKLHNGAIRAESKLGEGSVFTMWLPLRFNSC